MFRVWGSDNVTEILLADEVKRFVAEGTVRSRLYSDVASLTVPPTTTQATIPNVIMFIIMPQRLRRTPVMPVRPDYRYAAGWRVSNVPSLRRTQRRARGLRKSSSYLLCHFAVLFRIALAGSPMRDRKRALMERQMPTWGGVCGILATHSPALAHVR